MFFEVNVAASSGSNRTGRITLNSMEVRRLIELRDNEKALAIIELGSHGDLERLWVTDPYTKIRDILFGLDV